MSENNLHHANIITGGNGRDFVFEILKRDLNFEAKANPDFLLLEMETFGIDDARDFKKWAAGKPLLGGYKASLIAAQSVTHEAQNALLKVLEEPPAGTFIFIVLEDLGGLLPTFISRARMLESPASNATKKEEGSARKFLHSGIKGKFEIIRSLSKEKDKIRMKELIKNLEEVCYKDFPDKTETARSILTAKVFASARGASPKMLLEWLACMV